MGDLKSSAGPRKPKYLSRLWSAYLKWESVRLLRRAMQCDPRHVQAFIQGSAQRLALQGTLRFLDKEGFSHCAACPSRGPLIKIRPGLYACKVHQVEVGNVAAKIEEERRAKDAAKEERRALAAA